MGDLEEEEEGPEQVSVAVALRAPPQPPQHRRSWLRWRERRQSLHARNDRHGRVDRVMDGRLAGGQDRWIELGATQGLARREENERSRRGWSRRISSIAWKMKKYCSLVCTIPGRYCRSSSTTWRMVRVDSPRVYRDKKAWIDIKVPARPIPVHKVSTRQERAEREREREKHTSTTVDKNR